MLGEEGARRSERDPAAFGGDLRGLLEGRDDLPPVWCATGGNLPLDPLSNPIILGRRSRVRGFRVKRFRCHSFDRVGDRFSDRVRGAFAAFDAAQCRLLAGLALRARGVRLQVDEGVIGRAVPGSAMTLSRSPARLEDAPKPVTAVTG